MTLTESLMTMMITLMALIDTTDGTDEGLTQRVAFALWEERQRFSGPMTGKKVAEGWKVICL